MLATNVDRFPALRRQLDGLSLGGGKWPADRNARVRSAQNLLEVLRKLEKPPEVEVAMVRGSADPELARMVEESAMHADGLFGILETLSQLRTETRKLPEYLRNPLGVALVKWIDDVREHAAVASLLAGDDRYQELGYSAAVYPNDPPDEPNNIFG